jgi:signal recognition particle receptor subunit alpha
LRSLDSENKQRGLFSKMSTAFSNFTGNKELTEDDIRPILKELSDGMVDKNVAKEVADELSMSVLKSLIGQKTQSFTSIENTVQEALMMAIQKLLTPKRNIDILKEALSAKQKGQVFSMVFIGVNGVGKSTSLSKMAYYLKEKGGLKVMLAGCDNFRSGAIEQLK